MELIKKCVEQLWVNTHLSFMFATCTQVQKLCGDDDGRTALVGFLNQLQGTGVRVVFFTRPTSLSKFVYMDCYLK